MSPGGIQNPQSQQASGRRPTPLTARRLKPALLLLKLYILQHFHVCLLVPSTNLVNTLCALPLQSTDNAVLTDRCNQLSFNDVTYYLEFPVDLYLLCSVFLSVVFSQLPWLGNDFWISQAKCSHMCLWQLYHLIVTNSQGRESSNCR
jgi:hypothetical protein